MRQPARHDQNVASADPTTAQDLIHSLQVAWIRFSGGELHADADGVQRRWPRPRGTARANVTPRRSEHTFKTFSYSSEGPRLHDEPVRFCRRPVGWKPVVTTGEFTLTNSSVKTRTAIVNREFRNILQPRGIIPVAAGDCRVVQDEGTADIASQTVEWLQMEVTECITRNRWRFRLSDPNFFSHRHSTCLPLIFSIRFWSVAAIRMLILFF